ncbi:hypothetical protein HRbin39_00261 [bacterium HR39]|nr:hypothetical protein HRbin39_00261 [bacterium HR39]
MAVCSTDGGRGSAGVGFLGPPSGRSGVALRPGAPMSATGSRRTGSAPVRHARRGLPASRGTVPDGCPPERGAGDLPGWRRPAGGRRRRHGMRDPPLGVRVPPEGSVPGADRRVAAGTGATASRAPPSVEAETGASGCGRPVGGGCALSPTPAFGNGAGPACRTSLRCRGRRQYGSGKPPPGRRHPAGSGRRQDRDAGGTGSRRRRLPTHRRPDGDGPERGPRSGTRGIREGRLHPASSSTSITVPTAMR